MGDVVEFVVEELGAMADRIVRDLTMRVEELTQKLEEKDEEILDLQSIRATEKQKRLDLLEDDRKTLSSLLVLLILAFPVLYIVQTLLVLLIR